MYGTALLFIILAYAKFWIITIMSETISISILYKIITYLPFHTHTYIQYICETTHSLWDYYGKLNRRYNAFDDFQITNVYNVLRSIYSSHIPQDIFRILWCLYCCCTEFYNVLFGSLCGCRPLLKASIWFYRQQLYVQSLAYKRWNAGWTGLKSNTLKCSDSLLTPNHLHVFTTLMLGRIALSWVSGLEIKLTIL